MPETYNNSGDNRDSLNVQGSNFQNFGQTAGTIINVPLGRTRPPLAHTKNLKYRANRVEQERRIYDSLASHLKTAARRPIVLVAHGAASQCLDSFSQRLTDHTLPRYLKTLVGSDQSKCHDVRWPAAARRPAANRERDYKDMLTLKLEIQSDANSEAIVDQIANNRCPMLLTSVHTEVEGDDEETTLGAVLGFWSQMVDLQTDLSLIIVLAFIYADARPGLLARFRPKLGPPALAQKLANFANYLPDRLRVVVLPELVNVTLKDAEDWVKDVLRPLDVDIEDALRRARQVFGRPDASMPMRLLAEHLEALVPKDREVFRQL